MSNVAERQAFEQRTVAKPNGCIEWIGPLHDTSYGRFTFKSKQRLAHRAAWELFRGDLPANACVLHRCDNPPCVNPDHLFLGDRGDNARDMAAKGRQWVQKNPQGRPVCPDELRARGEAHGMSKLTQADVLAIRRRSSRGELGKHLALEFQCAKTLISAVINGLIWAHVGGPIKTPRTKRTFHD